MLLGYITNGLQNHRLPDALRLLADHGYQAVGLTLDVGHLDPSTATAADVDRTAKLCDQLGLKVIIETGARFVLDPTHKHEPTLMTRDRAARERRIAFYEQAAEVGRDLGAEVLSFWSGVDRSAEPNAWEWMCEGVAETCARVRARGLIPSFEPEPGMAVASMRDFDRLEATLAGDAPALTLDIGHLYVTETEPVIELIGRYAAKLAQVHLEDIQRGVHEHLLPGEGDVDSEGVLTALAASEFRGAVCFELSRSSHMAPVAVSMCQSLWGRLT